MCSTHWCFGDCEQCIAEKEFERKLEEDNVECPHRKECNWVVVHVKQDKCTTCRKTFNY